MRLSFSTKALSVIAGAAMLGATMSAPASAFTLASPSIGEQFSAAGHADKVWWRGGWGWRGGGWRGGWHGGWGWRGGWGYRPWGWGYRPWGWGGGWCRWHPYRCGW